MQDGPFNIPTRRRVWQGRPMVSMSYFTKGTKNHWPKQQKYLGSILNARSEPLKIIIEKKFNRNFNYFSGINITLSLIAIIARVIIFNAKRCTHYVTTLSILNII